MKQLILILVLSASIFSANAQYYAIPEDRITIGAGMGYGTKGNNTLANLQVEYNLAHFRLAYSQTMFFASSRPAFVEARVGYEIGSIWSIIPHVGYAIELVDIDQGKTTTHITYGSELDWHLAILKKPDPKLYLDYNRAGQYNLFAFGLKVSL